MEIELTSLKEPNQDYFRRMVDYVGFKSFFINEEELREMFFNMVCDLKMVESKGLLAEEYFGKNPQAMIDEILQAILRKSWRSVFTAVSVIAFIVGAFSFMLDWFWLVPFKLRLWVYVLDILQAFSILLLFFLIWSKTIYQGFRKGRAFLLMFIAYHLICGGTRYLKLVHGQWGLVSLSPLLQVVLGLPLLALLVLMTYKDRYGQFLSTGFASFFLAGLYKFFHLPQKSVVPFVILLLGVALRMFVAKKGEKKYEQ